MQQSNKVTVVARNLGKSYYLHKSGSQIGLSRKKNQIVVEALKGVSFVAHAGESIGVVGRNGSGKSTLFRLIAGSEDPTSGEVFVSQEPTLLGVSAALQNDLSGAANVRLGLLAMGLTPDEVDEMQEGVAEWAEVQDAIDRPLKTYSSGMRARLVFSISTSVKREILLIDEALSTGDSSFAAKSKERMNSFLEEAGTVFIVSHGAGTIQNYCTRAIWLDNGEIIADGDSLEVATAYVRWSKLRAKDKEAEADKFLQKHKDAYIRPIIFTDNEAISILDS